MLEFDNISRKYSIIATIGNITDVISFSKLEIKQSTLSIQENHISEDIQIV